ncbi:MAG TPA: hypothetical protein VFN72_04990 [Solirubrobacterales bacterium]|nr:hypothetical protein [Solirubrobacterales bacterium]
MKVRWMAEVARPELPATWVMEGDDLYCLGCRREMAGEAAVEALDEKATSERRHRAESRGRIEFEMKRRPEREDSRIAQACHTSVKAVREARVRLGLQSRRPR